MSLAISPVGNIAKEIQREIILSFLKKVRGKCCDKKGYCDECEWRMDDCINTAEALVGKSDDQLTAFIEKVMEE